MREGLIIALRAVPAVALVTEEFWAKGDFIASSFGMPDIPRVQLPYPVAGTGPYSHRIIVDKAAAEIVEALEPSR